MLNFVPLFVFKNVSHVIFILLTKPNFIVWLPLLLEILGSVCTPILIMPFRCMTKKSRLKLKYLENEKSFFIIFKGLSVVNNCLRLESAPLKLIMLISIIMINFYYEENIHWKWDLKLDRKISPGRLPNLRFSDAFRVYEKETPSSNGLITFSTLFTKDFLNSFMTEALII